MDWKTFSGGYVFVNGVSKLYNQPITFQDDASRLWELSLRMCDLDQH